MDCFFLFRIVKNVVNEDDSINTSDSENQVVDVALYCMLAMFVSREPHQCEKQQWWNENIYEGTMKASPKSESAPACSSTCIVLCLNVHRHCDVERKCKLNIRHAWGGLRCFEMELQVLFFFRLRLPWRSFVHRRSGCRRLSERPKSRWH